MATILYSAYSAIQAIVGAVSDMFPSQDEMPHIPQFGAAEWQEHFDLELAEPSIPENLKSYLETPCPFWPDKLVKETHFLCLIPSDISLNKLYTLNKHESNSPILKQFSQSTSRSYWMLVTKKTIPGTEGQPFETQSRVLSNGNYQVPNVLEAATAVAIAKVLNTKLYPSQNQFTVCQEKYNDSHVLIGYDQFTPYAIYVNSWGSSCGVAGVRK